MTGIHRQPLGEIYHEIRETIIRKLENDERLEEIKEVIYGEKKRIGTLQTPAIWIVPNSYVPELKGGKTADHDIPFDFVTFVKDDEPETGLKKAQELAFNIYDVIIEDRTLDGFVHDIRPTRIDPAYEAGNATHLYWSAVQFAFRLKRRE